VTLLVTKGRTQSVQGGIPTRERGNDLQPWLLLAFHHQGQNVIAGHQFSQLIGHFHIPGNHAELISGAMVPNGDGFYVSPTLVINPDDRLSLTRDEVFGPVVTLTRVADAEEAQAKTNDTEYGLTASVWTRSLSAAMDLTPGIEAGTVWVNSHTLMMRTCLLVVSNSLEAGEISAPIGSTRSLKPNLFAYDIENRK